MMFGLGFEKVKVFDFSLKLNSLLFAKALKICYCTFSVNTFVRVGTGGLPSRPLLDLLA